MGGQVTAGRTVSAAWPPAAASARRLVVAVLVAVLLVGAAAGCGEAGPSDEAVDGSTQPIEAANSTTTTSAPLAAGRPYAFTAWNETFVDTSRATPAYLDLPEAPQRTLLTTIYLPEGDGPFPLIAFAHGLAGHPDKFSELLSAWATAGYVVLAPSFPLTNGQTGGGFTTSADLANQPADVSFAIDEVLRLNDDPASPLHDKVDPESIGAAGLSLGAATTYALAFNTCCADDRIDATQVFAGAQLPIQAGEYQLDGRVPLLIVHGDLDLGFRIDNATTAFAAAQPPVWFVTLHGAGHAPPFENDVTPHDDLVELLTTDFWDATIGGDAEAMARFEAAAAVDGLSTLQSNP